MIQLQERRNQATPVLYRDRSRLYQYVRNKLS
jgi:hypothetical protein